MKNPVEYYERYGYEATWIHEEHLTPEHYERIQREIRFMDRYDLVSVSDKVPAYERLGDSLRRKGACCPSPHRLWGARTTQWRPYREKQWRKHRAVVVVLEPFSLSREDMEELIRLDQLGIAMQIGRDEHRLCPLLTPVMLWRRDAAPLLGLD